MMENTGRPAWFLVTVALVVILILLVVLCLSGCGGADDSESSESPVEELVEEEPTPIEDTLTVDDGIWRVDEKLSVPPDCRKPCLTISEDTEVVPKSAKGKIRVTEIEPSEIGEGRPYPPLAGKKVLAAAEITPDGMTFSPHAYLEFNLPAGCHYEEGETLSLVRLDEESGKWVDAGVAEVCNPPSVAKGKIFHTSVYAVVVPIEPTETPVPPTKEVPRCVVIVPRLNLRRGPGHVYAPPIRTLTQATELEPLAEYAPGFPEGRWIEVRVYDTGELGWVSADPSYVACPDLDNLPVGEAPPTPSPILTPTATPTPTTTPTPTPTFTPTPTVCIDFEGVPLGGYSYDEPFTVPGADILIQDRASIVDYGYAGGSGHELRTGHSGITFGFGRNLTGLSLRYHLRYEGEIGDPWIEMNGDQRAGTRVRELDGLTIGGVTVAVTESEGQTGRLELRGAFDTLSIGGDFLYIDDVCPR